MKALVTGGAGFIGRRLVDRLLSDGAAVSVLDDLSTGNASRLNPDADFILGSILDAKIVERAIANADVVFHLAAIASVEKCTADFVSSHAVNLTGFLTVLDSARRASPSPKIVYASSAAVYGSNESTPLAECDATRPVSPYGADKLACELHAKSAYEVYGLRSVGLRFFNVYGPGQDPSSPYSGVISRFVERALAGQAILIHGDGLQTRDFVYVDDVVEAIVCSAEVEMDNPAEVFNVCTGVETSILGLARAVVDQVGDAPELVHVRERTGDVQRSLGSPLYLRGHLNVPLPVNISAGLRAFMASLRALEAD